MGNCQQNVKVLDQLGTQQSQSHLINHWKNLPSYDKRRTFQQQLNKAKLSETIRIYKGSSFSTSRSTSLGSSRQSDKIASIENFHPIHQKYIMKRQQIQQQRSQLTKIGLSAIKNGQVGVFIMSGNQNPELNIDFPIGIYDIGLDSACSIFEILIHRLRRLNQMSEAPDNKNIKLYIMTSVQNKQQIKNYFKQKNYFGYGLTNVFFFSQVSQPVVNDHGRIVLRNQSDIYKSPRGNGGIYTCIKDKNLINHLQNQGVKYVYFGPVNNILLKVADPCTLGLLIRQNKQVVASCFQSKSNLFGYFGLSDNLKSTKVYESSVPNDNKKWANAGSCFMTLQFLNMIVNNQSFIKKIRQQFHDIVKQTIVFDPISNKRTIQKCIFFQNFYHQAFSYTDRILLAQINQNNEFAPIRNNLSNNEKYSINYARDAYWNWNRLLFEKVGVQFTGSGHIQIHPSLTYQGENILEIVKQKHLRQVIKLPQFIK